MWRHYESNSADKNSPAPNSPLSVSVIGPPLRLTVEGGAQPPARLTLGIDDGRDGPKRSADAPNVNVMSPWAVAPRPIARAARSASGQIRQSIVASLARRTRRHRAHDWLRHVEFPHSLTSTIDRVSLERFVVATRQIAARNTL